MRVLPASDASLLIVFGDEPREEHQRDVLNLFLRLQSSQDTRIRNLHPAYSSLLIDFDPLTTDHEVMAQVVEALAVSDADAIQLSVREVVIPVCYGGEFGPDLHFVAEHAHVSTDELIRLHSSAEYSVAFMGFSPGFGYLTGLPEALAVPRHATPRKLVATGSVGIAGKQTGVYPLASPGGWQLIGRTPLRMFDAQNAPPSRLQVGDRVVFKPITLEEFESISRSPQEPW